MLKQNKQLYFKEKDMGIVRKIWSFADRVYDRGKYYSDPINNHEVEKEIKIENDVVKIWKNDEELIIAYRGSDDFQDWVENLTQNPHAGLENFYDIYLEFREPISEVIKRNLDKKITLTAHSKCGPSAQHMARYISRTFKKCSCFTFACPPHLSKKDRDEYNMERVNYTNIINPGDIVSTSLLFKLFNLKRAGKDVYLPKKWYDYLPIRRVTQHLTKNYWKRIKKLKLDKL